MRVIIVPKLIKINSVSEAVRTKMGDYKIDQILCATRKVPLKAVILRSFKSE